MKRNPWPLGIITAFAVFISATVGLILFACAHPTDLVNADYYEQEIKYQSRLDSLERANKLEASATVKYDAMNGLIHIALPAQHAGAVGQIQLYRPSEARLDQSFPLSTGANGFQILNAARLREGPWKVVVTWNVNGEEFCLDQKIVVARKT